MSSPEIKKPNGYEIGSGLNSFLSLESSTHGAFVETAEVLSTRFDSVRLVTARWDADVYLARERAAGANSRPIALKVLPTGAAGDPHRVDLFRREACSAAKLDHRNILKSTPPEEFNGLQYTQLEHRPKAESLKNLIDREGWLDVRLAIEIIHQIADALEHAHDRRVLHLRIQPDNVLIDPDGTATLADFGIEGRIDLSEAHRERASLCPVHYISPEQVQGGILDARSDLYSLGVVFYQMLTDRLPVDSTDSDSVRRKHLTQTPLPPHLYSSRIPLRLSEVITRLLEKEPARRFQDVASFRVELDNAFRAPVTQVLPSDQPAAKEDPDRETSRAIETSNAGRERWEVPSIIRISHEAALDSPIALPEETAQPGKAVPIAGGLDDPEHSIERPVFNLIPQSSQSAPLSPIVLVVVLTAAVLFGILVLAHFNSGKNAAPPTLPNRGHAADPSQTTPALSTDATRTETSQQSAGGQPAN